MWATFDCAKTVVCAPKSNKAAKSNTLSFFICKGIKFLF
jgi:hypothetical protein